VTSGTGGDRGVIREQPETGGSERMAEEKGGKISRRDLLKGVGLAGAAAILPSGVERAAGAQATPVSPPPPVAPAVRIAAAAPRPSRTENLTAEEAELLEAIMRRLIPNDEHGPGAVEAGALTYVDRALGGFLSDSREAYRSGLAAFDRYCRMSRGASFLELSTVDQDSTLIDCEGGSATGSGAGFTGSSAAFFGMIKSHTWQGVFGDPYYGGNVDFIGWDLIRYPGVRTGVSAADQERLESGELPVVRRSAYESDMFEKATVHRATGDETHGD
jgi:gluconate 2-dehydrogenase gamma chain